MWVGLDDGGTTLASAVRLTTPLAFAACGEYLAERAGTINISVEGMLLSGAFAGVAAASATGSASLGLGAGLLAGTGVALVHGLLSHAVAINTFVVGLVLNALVLGLTTYLLQLSSFDDHQVDVLPLPLLRDLPLVGDALFAQRWPSYLLLVLVPMTWWLVERTRWGLELRAAGEDPQAADATGVPVDRRRRQALLWCGALAGLGGAVLSVGLVGSFNADMTAGRGFIVLAAVIFGAWRLAGTLLGCFLFGLPARARGARGRRAVPA